MYVLPNEEVLSIKNEKLLLQGLQPIESVLSDKNVKRLVSAWWQVIKQLYQGWVDSLVRVALSTQL